MDPLPPDVQHVEDLTTEHLGGATQPELEAFRMAAMQLELHLECSERVAILVLLEDGDWRENVAERVPFSEGSPTARSTCTPAGGSEALPAPLPLAGGGRPVDFDSRRATQPRRLPPSVSDSAESARATCEARRGRRRRDAT